MKAAGNNLMQIMFKICFITDGGNSLGLGHVQQSITFAREFEGEANICFLTKSDETILAKIRENGFDVTRHLNDADILHHLKKESPDVIIFDKLDVAEELARNIKNTLSAQLVIFTNLTSANRYADIAVTADIGSHFENVRFVDDETGTTYFYGPKYWVLRPEFYEYQRRGKDKVCKPTRILLIFGGSDPANLTSEALNQLLLLKRQLKVEIILGSHYGHLDELMKICQRHDSLSEHVTIYQNITNVAEIMYRADLVLASPGLSAFEALRVGTPVIVVPHDVLQRDTYQGFMRMLERDELSNLGTMLEMGDFTYPDDEKIVRMQIGDGVQELKSIIVNSKRTKNNEVG
jgi:spore coat polysaccharide biosynthesis predicted glycosyltransferase SpsG